MVSLILVAGAGCRKIPTENTDRNRPPETYLTAAPADTIGGGGPSRISHRYRAQWSGADVDGEVVGFFVAVTETTVDVATGRPFRLPAPRPSQYRFTTARESLFTFTVLEGRGTDREHALYVYAVDNQGKVDPTPAVTHFVARDQNLPGVRFLAALAQGTIYLPNGAGGVTPTPFTRVLRDSFELPLHAPVDTIPSGGTVHFEWQGYDPDFGSYITGYLYKLVETEFIRADSTARSVDYGTPFSPTPGPIPIGLNTFRIRAIDEAGGTTQPDAVRVFFVNFSPDTWFSGPDPNDPALAGRLFTDENGTYFETLQGPPAADWGRPVDFPGNPLTDTLSLLPAERPVTDGLQGRVKTIMEQRTLLDRTVRDYIRNENDTVAFGSLIVARLGGSDKDSPYSVRGGNPDSVSRLYRSGPANGSPVAFQARVVTQFANGGAEEPPFSTAFPNVDVLDPLNNQAVLFTVDQVDNTGRSYLQARAVDGDRTGDNRIGDVVRDAARFELEGNPLRSKIFTFYTNFKPGLQLFSPTPGTVLNPVGDRFSITIRCSDADPDPSNPRQGVSPYTTMYFALRARIYSTGDVPGPEQGWQDPVLGFYLPEPGPFFPYTPPISLEVDAASDLPTGPATLEIEVVDNVDRSKGRIIKVLVPVYWRVGP
ncbi:MAG: hypothetical protein ABI960_10475 [Candidatus Eisenbacteria bacterium]